MKNALIKLILTGIGLVAMHSCQSEQFEGPWFATGIKIGESEWSSLEWQRVDPRKDFTSQFKLSGLEAGEACEVVVEAAPLKGGKVSASMEGSFKTAPGSDQESDVDSEKGYKLYPSSLKLDPEFFVLTGDIVYYDFEGKTAELARWHWDRMYSYPNNIEYHRQVASYFIKDDHDTWMDDAYPGKKSRFMGEFTEGDMVRKFISEQENMYVICRDRHWQYIFRDLKTGVTEFSCGPGSDTHAGGWSNDQLLPEHLYLNVTGGFLEAKVSRLTGEPQLTIRHYNPDGNLLNDYITKL